MTTAIIHVLAYLGGALGGAAIALKLTGFYRPRS